jgi:hypothetical protein
MNVNYLLIQIHFYKSLYYSNLNYFSKIIEQNMFRTFTEIYWNNADILNL